MVCFSVLLYVWRVELTVCLFIVDSHVPAHGSREILVIMGSLTTTDPGNIHDTITQLTQDNIRASVIALAAEVQVLKVLTTQTKGTCHTIHLP